MRKESLIKLKFRKEVVEELKGLEVVKVPGFMPELNGKASEYLQAFANGVIDLRDPDRQLRPGRPSDKLLGRAAYEFGPPDPEQTAFVKRLYADWFVSEDGTPNEEYVEFVVTLLASALDGVVRGSKQIMLFFIGFSAANGMLEALSSLGAGCLRHNARTHVLLLAVAGKTLLTTFLQDTIGAMATTLTPPFSRSVRIPASLMNTWRALCRVA